MRRLCLVAAVLLALACSRRRLALAPELAQAAAPPLPVETRRHAAGNALEGHSQGTLAFGPHVADWERAPMRVHRAAPGPGARCGTEGAFAFALRAQPSRRVRCEEWMEGTSRLGGQGPRAITDDRIAHHLRCQLADGALAVSDAEPGSGGSPEGGADPEAALPRGEAQLQGVRLALEPAFPTGSGWTRAWGFTLREGGRAVAAVQTQEPRGVWLAPGLPARTREAVALAAAALLLADPGQLRCADLGR